MTIAQLLTCGVWIQLLARSMGLDNAKWQTIGIWVQAIATLGLAVFALRGLSAWKAQTRAAYRIETLRSLIRSAFSLLTAINDSRGLIRRNERSADVAEWQPREVAKSAPIFRASATRIGSSIDSFVQLLLEARGSWRANSELIKRGRSFANEANRLLNAFEQLAMILENRNGGPTAYSDEERRKLVLVCIGDSPSPVDPEVAELMTQFKALQSQIRTEFESVQK